MQLHFSVRSVNYGEIRFADICREVSLAAWRIVTTSPQLKYLKQLPPRDRANGVFEIFRLAVDNFRKGTGLADLCLRASPLLYHGLGAQLRTTVIPHFKIEEGSASLFPIRFDLTRRCQFMEFRFPVIQFPERSPEVAHPRL